MTILMILETQFPPDDRVEKEAVALINQGHNVHLVCTTFTGKSSIEKYNNITVHRLKCNKFLFKKSKGSALTLPFYFLFWRRIIYSLIKRIGAQAVHVHDLPLARVGIEAKRKFNVRTTLDFHENYPYLLATAPYSQTVMGKLLMPIRKWINYEAEVIQHADNVIVTVKEMGERIKQLHPDLQYTIVENTFSEEMFPSPISYKKDDSKIKLVYIGGVEKHRGIDIAIKGFIEALKTTNDIEFHIHGKGRYLEAIKDIAKTNHIEDKVFFHPLLKFPAEAVRLSYYDIGIIPHIRSVQNNCSSPNKLYQYMYYGLAILSSDCNSLKRVIEETKTGRTYQAESALDFALSLNAMLSENLSQMKSNGHACVTAKYNWKNSVENLIAIYESKTSEHKDMILE